MTHDVTLLWEGFLTIDVPSNWESQESDGVIAIYDPQGAGVLHFSFATGPTDAVVDVEQEAAAFANSIGLENSVAGVNRTRIGTWDAGYVDGYRYRPDRQFWRVWVAAHAGRIASVTYNCSADDMEVERGQIDRVLANARLS